MKPVEAFDYFPSFANAGTRVAPGGDPTSAKYTLGMVPADTFPAEWANYFFHGSTKGISALNTAVNSIWTELQNLLEEYGINPSSADTSQLIAAINKVYPQITSCNTPAATAAKTIAVSGNVLKAGCVYVIEMTYGNTAANPTLSINNGTAYPMCNSIGTALESGAWGAGDTITVLFTGSKYLMATAITNAIENTNMKVATSNAVYNFKTDTIQNGNSKPATSNAVYNYKAERLENGNSKPVTSNDMSCIFANSTTITGPKLGTGGRVKIMFTVTLSGTNTSTPLTITYNRTQYTVKVNRDGSLTNLYAHEIGNTIRYIQAYTTIEFIFNGTNLIIDGNPIVLSSSEYTIYADRKVGSDPVGSLKEFFLQNVPYGYLACDGSTYDITKYDALYARLGTNRLPDFRNKFIMGNGANVVGTEKSAGLPEIEGSLYFRSLYNGASPVISNDGAFVVGTSSSSANSFQGDSVQGTHIIKFKASEANNIYGNSNTVQPPAICALIAIKAM